MDRKQTKELYEKYGFLIFGRCLSILGNEDDARDALHDVFLKLTAKIDTLRDRSKIVPWIYASTTNHCFNVLRMRRRFVDQPAEDAICETHEHDSAYEKRDLIERIMRFHDARVRDAVYFTFVEELNQEEIREITGQSPATIRRNLKKFKDSLPSIAKRLGYA